MERFFLPELRWQRIHDVPFASWVDLSHLLSILDHICGYGVRVQMSAAAIILYGGRDRFSLAHDSVGAMCPGTPDQLIQFVERHGGDPAWDYMPHYKRLMSLLIRLRACDWGLLRHGYLKNSLERLDKDVSEWLAWSPLPGELCAIVREYLLPADDWFERRLELALE